MTEVKTKKGTLRTYDIGDEDYPGIWVTYTPDGATEEIDIACVEQANDSESVNLYFYGNPECDDWTQKSEISLSAIEKAVVDSNFHDRVAKLKNELADAGIEMDILEKINPVQLSAEFFANADAPAIIRFRKGGISFFVKEEGHLACSLDMGNGEERTFDTTKDSDTFSEVMEIKTDAELVAKRQQNLLYTANNQFTVYCERNGEVFATDIIYSLEELLDNPDFVKTLFFKTQVPGGAGSIILLVGRSGSGKSTVAAELEKRGLSQVFSYTTRPPRYDGEKGHVFVTSEEFDSVRDDLCAYTYFNGYEYGATNAQVEENDIYVIDPAGVEYFRKAYKGTKTPVVCYLDVDEITAKKRMINRGDNPKNVEKRIAHDREKFSKTSIDEMSPVIISAACKSPEEIADIIVSSVFEEKEKKEKKMKNVRSECVAWGVIIGALLMVYIIMKHVMREEFPGIMDVLLMTLCVPAGISIGDLVGSLLEKQYNNKEG